MKMPAGLVVDANVLIDYAKAEKSILSLTSKNICRLYVPSPVVDEVKDLKKAEYPGLGMTIAELNMEQLLEAGKGSSRLSFEDRCCLILARDNQWACLTNERALRRACEEAKVNVYYGLELPLMLVERSVLKKQQARKTANQVREDSGGHYTEKVMNEFERRLKEL